MRLELNGGIRVDEVHRRGVQTAQDVRAVPGQGFPICKVADCNLSGANDIRHLGVSLAAPTSSSPKGISSSYSSGIIESPLDTRSTDQARTLANLLCLRAQNLQLLEGDFLASVATMG